MKNKIFLMMFAVLLISLVSVQGLSTMPPQGFVTSANQYYSVTYDGEGEAFVSARITLTNQDDNPISKVALEVPSGNMLLLGALQETTAQTTKVCTSWNDECVEYGQGSTCVKYDYNGNCLTYDTPCLRYDKVCKAYKTNYQYQKIYEKLNLEPQTLAVTTLLPIELAMPLEKGGSTEILLIYKVNDMSKKGVGTYKFDFETIRIPYMTNSIRVSVNVQDDLYLKGTSSQVNYISNPIGLSYAMDASSSKLSSEQSQEVRTYTQSIGNTGGYVKSTSYLDPHESYTVEGKYGKSWFSIYWGTFVWIILAIVIIFFLIMHGVKKLKHYETEHVPEKHRVHHSKDKHKFVIPFISGLITAVGIGLVWVISIVLLSVLEGILRSGAEQVFAFVVILFAILISLAAMIGIPIYTGNRYGASTGVFTMLSMLGWMFVFAIVIILVTALLTGGVRYY